MKSKYLSQIEFIICAVATIFVISGCSSKIPIAPRSAQTDNIPPYFVDLEFPEDNSFAPEGTLLITGQLLDDDSGYHPGTPVYLDIDVLGAQGQVWTKRFNVADYESPYPSYFDFETGEFRIEFGDYQRLKPFRLFLHLYGEDAERNVSNPIEAHVTVGEIIADPMPSSEALYQARTEYGQNMLALLEAHRRCYAIYGNQYSHDIQVINYLKQFVTATYVNSPAMDTWTVPLDTLVSQILALPHLNPVYKASLDEVILFFQDYIEGEQARLADPFYIPGYSAEQILARRALVPPWYETDFQINFTTTYQGILTYDINLNVIGWKYDDPLEMINIADYTIVANPLSPLVIEGRFGAVEFERIQYITPEDYNPPLILFALFQDTGVGTTVLLRTD
jgi:hypothetical protein